MRSGIQVRRAMRGLEGEIGIGIPSLISEICFFAGAHTYSRRLKWKSCYELPWSGDTYPTIQGHIALDTPIVDEDNNTDSFSFKSKRLLLCAGSKVQASKQSRIAVPVMRPQP